MMRNVGKITLLSYATRKDPEEHARPCSLIWTFPVRPHILQYPVLHKKQCRTLLNAVH